MAHRRESPIHAARPTARRGAGHSLRLLALVATLGFLAYLIPLCDAVPAATVAHPLDRTRAIRLARNLQVDHDLNATHGSLPRLASPAAGPAPAHLPHPPLVEPARLDDPDASEWYPSPYYRADLSRSPPRG